MKLFGVYCGEDHDSGYIAGIFTSEELALNFILNNGFTKVVIQMAGISRHYERPDDCWSYCVIGEYLLDEEVPIP